MKFRKALLSELNTILELYEELITTIKQDTHTPEWIWGVYPKKEHIKSAIESDELYVGEKDSKIVSSLVLNHTPNAGFEDLTWNVNEDYENVYVIHLVAVKHDYRGHGFAKAMLNHVFEIAKNNNIKSIRLSIIKNNIPAENLYKKFDFKYIDSVDVDDKDRGLKSFKVYEKII